MSNHHDRVLEEKKKIDTTENGDKMNELVIIQKEKEKSLCRLVINDKTVIYVPEHKCNEEYRKQWMKKHGFVLSAEKTPKQHYKQKTVLNFMEISTKIYDGIPLNDIAESLGLTGRYLRERLRKEGIHVPTCNEIISLLKSKGKTEEEICQVTRIRSDIVHRYCTT